MSKYLYPKIEPYEQGRLALDPPHEMYWEQCGNPDGEPAVFLHGGPGAGINATHRRFFDPSHYRVVLFDQRGAGRSKPVAELRDNTTAHVIADMELLRERLGIKSWHVFGGSWGSTLAMAYAQRHPSRCRALILRGIFLGSDAEVEWFLYGMQRIFPEAWRAFSEHIPASERDNLLGAYLTRLSDDDPAVRGPAARVWSSYEGACSTLLPNRTVTAAGGGDSALALARIEAHYFANRFFLEDGELLRNLGRIAHLPAAIVHGRYDIVCPVMTADKLAAAWPSAEYNVVPDAGHSALEPGIQRELVRATDRLRSI